MLNKESELDVSHDINPKRTLYHAEKVHNLLVKSIHNKKPMDFKLQYFVSRSEIINPGQYCVEVVPTRIEARGIL